MISSLRSLFLVVSSGITFFSLAQLPVVDLTIAPGTNNDLEVRLRPTLDFDGVLSGLVVTVRWDAASSAHLGGISQTVPANQYVALGKSGGEIDDSGNRYQVFAGFGFTALSDIPTQWTAGTEYTIGNLAVNGGPTVFDAVNDGWTSTHNGDFFISLNGQDQTGVIYETSTGVVAGTSELNHLSVEPNPAQEGATIMARVAPGSDVALVLLNTAAQEVWKRSVLSSTGAIREPLDLAHLDNGVYMLRMTTADAVITQRVVKK